MPGEAEDFNPQQERGRQGGRPSQKDDKLPEAKKLLSQGLTEQEVAERMGITTRTLYNWLNPKKGVQ